MILMSGGARAESKIGQAAAAKNQVQGILDGPPRTISVGSDIFSNELVRTGDGGLARLVFLDNTDLAVGPRSEIRLDKFVYDPTGATGSVIVQVGRGAFRFVTGRQDHRNYRINTPYATLGVRGTVFEAVVTNEKVDLLLKNGGLEVRTFLNQVFELRCEQVLPVQSCGPNSLSIAANGHVTGPFNAPPNSSILPFDVAALGGSDVTGALGGGGGAGGQTSPIPAGGSGGNAEGIAAVRGVPTTTGSAPFAFTLSSSPSSISLSVSP
jgi:hypothetical protein